MLWINVWDHSEDCKEFEYIIDYDQSFPNKSQHWQSSNPFSSSSYPLKTLWFHIDNAVNISQDAMPLDILISEHSLARITARKLGYLLGCTADPVWTGLSLSWGWSCVDALERKEVTWSSWLLFQHNQNRPMRPASLLDQAGCFTAHSFHLPI